MRVKDLWKKVLIAGVTAGSAMVIAACYGAYYGPRQPPPAPVRGPVMHTVKPRPVSCAVRPGGPAPRCSVVDPLPPENDPGSVENVAKIPPPAK